MLQRLLGYICVGAALVLVSAAVYLGTRRGDIPLIFSPTQVLGATWSDYKFGYLDPSGRVVDRQRNDVTTSEGESYAMLRAVWMDDKTTFDTSLAWTKDNLDRTEDRLFAWLFGPDQDGRYGIRTEQGGYNTASDADQDIALALIFAYARWQDLTYLGDARVIVRDIWEKEVVTIRGTPYLAANNVEKTSEASGVLINVSYLAPYAYRIFAVIDPDHPWGALVDSSYELIDRALDEPSLGSSAGLPPDWLRIDKTTGELHPAEAPLTTNYSYDALRTPWRLALDWQWYEDSRAKALLEKMSFLSDEWRATGRLGSSYAHDGTVLDATETPAMYGGSLGYFMVADPDAARDLYERKLQYLWDPNTNTWAERLPYYDDNWAWFGIALYHRLLPNLFTSLPLQLYEL